MDGPNGRPEPGYNPEPNQRPQTGDTPTTNSPGAPAPGGTAMPEAISFRQLEALRQSAIEAARSSGPTAGSSDSPVASLLQGTSPTKGQLQPEHHQPWGDDLEELEQLLGAYGQVGEQLLQQLARQGSALEQHRHPQQVMALGALGAHIRLGLQALAASRR
ncbi:MAG: hypothetical protein CK536_07475 [Synechococcus sp. Baikal-G1]|nr:MAG: hypothetical protein CK536_07475 [Synechococcus sp. Baikal-G1]